MGRMYDRGQATPRVEAWKKPCPLCNAEVTHQSAHGHLSRAHGAMFRVARWMLEKGMPETTFDELVRFIQKLERGE